MNTLKMMKAFVELELMNLVLFGDMSKEIEMAQRNYKRGMVTSYEAFDIIRDCLTVYDKRMEIVDKVVQEFNNQLDYERSFIAHIVSTKAEELAFKMVVGKEG